MYLKIHLKQAITILIILLFFGMIWLVGNSLNWFEKSIQNKDLQPAELAQVHFERGIEFYKKQKYQKATGELKNAITLNPEFEKAYRKIVAIANENNTLDDALAYFESLKTHYPNNPYPYFSVGLVRSAQKDYQRAIENYKAAIRLQPGTALVYSWLVGAFNLSGQLEPGMIWLDSLRVSNPNDALVYFGLAYGYSLVADWERVFENLKKALEIEPEFLMAMHLQMKALRETGALEESEQIGLKALSIADKQNNPELTFQIMNAIGGTYIEFGKFEKGLEFLEKALKIAEANAMQDQVIGMLNNIGLTHRYLGKYREALATFKKAFDLNARLKVEHTYGLLISNMGDVYLSLAKYDTALTFLTQSLEIFQKSKDHLATAQTLSSIAACYSLMADYDSALSYSQKASQLFQEIGDRGGFANELNNLAAIYIERGYYGKAFEYLNEALTIANQIGDQYVKSQVFSGFGNTYYGMRDFSQAIHYETLALELAKEIGDQSGESGSLINLAASEFEMGDFQSSQKRLEQALKIAEESNESKQVAICQTNLARIFQAQNNYSRAIQFYQKSQQIHEKIGNNYNAVQNLTEIGLLYEKMNRYSEANDFLAKALALGQKIGLAEVNWLSNYGLALLNEKQNKGSEALSNYKTAINHIEDIRKDLPKDEFKSSFLENKIQVYEKLIHLLYRMHQQQSDQGHDAEAFAYAERAKARSLLDLLAEAKIDLSSSLKPELAQRLRKIQRNIGRLQTESYDTNLLESRKKEIKHALEKEEDLLSQLLLEIKKQNPKFAQIQYPEPIKIQEVQKELKDDREVVLEYLIGTEYSYLWAISRDRIAMYPLPAQAEIEKIVKPYLEFLQKSPKSAGIPESIGRSVYDLVLKPAQAFMQKNTSLIVIPDGILYYLAFETIPVSDGTSPAQYLIESVRIQYAPSFSVLRFIRRQYQSQSLLEANPILLAFGDPIFNADRGDASVADTTTEDIERGLYQERGFYLKQLPHSAIEIEKIRNALPSGRSTCYLGAKASEQQFKTENLLQYRILHFATHGLVDEEQPGRSCIVFSLDADPEEDGFLQVSEIFDLKIAADLVVLSACQTGRGKLLAGEGILGLTRAFQYAGARSLVVSLWSVSDKSTSELMASFYRNLAAGQDQAAALRQAKLEFIRHPNPALRHPYYWAPFVLVGR